MPVSSQTLESRFPGVYAVGDVATVGVPKAGVFAEGAARVVAASLTATLRGDEQPAAYGGLGSCYIEFGAGRVGRVDVDFLSGPGRRGRSASRRSPWSRRSASSARSGVHGGLAGERVHVELAPEQPDQVAAAIAAALTEPAPDRAPGGRPAWTIRSGPSGYGVAAGRPRSTLGAARA